MVTHYKLTVALRGAYALDERLLQDIYEAAQTFLNSDIKTQIDCSDAYKIEAECLSDALDDAILRAHAITSINLSGDNYKEQPKRRFSFRAHDEIFLSTIQIDIEGSHKECAALGAQLEKLLSVKRQWYSPLVLNGTVSSAVTTVVVVATIVAAPVALTYFAFGPERIGIPIFIEMTLIWPILWMLHKFRKFFFPQLVVHIGRSADIAARARGARKLLLSSILLTLVVGVASSLIANRISK
jgi:hypothetical protein